MILLLTLSLMIVFSSVAFFELAIAELIPSWVKNTAKWYGEDKISEEEFLNAIKFLIDNKILVLDVIPTANETKSEIQDDASSAHIILPKGNFDVGNTGFYIPLNLNVASGTTVTWINSDTVPHTIQSQDAQGHIIPLFNSGILETGDQFTHTFDESGVYNYFCTLHPWRVGLVTVS